MARISTYAVDSEIVTTDKVLGTDSQGLTTKNFSFSAVKDWLNSSAVVGVVGQNTYTFQTIPGNPVVRESGSISLPGLGGDGTAFADITSMVFSERAADNSIATNYINTLIGKQVVLMQLDNLNNFGIYNLDSFTPLQGSPGFYTATLSVDYSNGNLISDQNYGFAVYGLQSASSINVLTIGTDREIGLTDELQSVYGGFNKESKLRLSTSKFEVSGTSITRSATNPTVRLIADAQDNPSAGEIMGTLRFTRNFEDPLALDLARAIYGDFKERVEADGGTVEGSEECVASELELIVAGEYLINMVDIKPEYAGSLGSTKADVVIYTNNGSGVPLEKARVTHDGDVIVKEPGKGVILHSVNDTPYRIVVGNDGSIEGIPPASTVPVITTLPAISGIVGVPETITAIAGSVTSLPAFTTSWQWQISDNGLTGWVNISGATANTLEITQAYGDKYLRVVQTTTNILGTVSANSLSTVQVQPWPQITALKVRMDYFENEDGADEALTYLNDTII